MTLYVSTPLLPPIPLEHCRNYVACPHNSDCGPAANRTPHRYKWGDDNGEPGLAVIVPPIPSAPHQYSALLLSRPSAQWVAGPPSPSAPPPLCPYATIHPNGPGRRSVTFMTILSPETHRPHATIHHMMATHSREGRTGPYVRQGDPRAPAGKPHVRSWIAADSPYSSPLPHTPTSHSHLPHHPQRRPHSAMPFMACPYCGVNYGALNERSPAGGPRQFEGTSYAKGTFVAALLAYNMISLW